MLLPFAASVIIFLGASLAEAIVHNRSGDFADFIMTQPDSPDDYHSRTNKCASRLQGSLEKLRKRQMNSKSSDFLDLSGYALHQSLRHLPLDMYVTDIRARTPKIGDWVRIEKCQFSNRDNRVMVRILFNDLAVSGIVWLLDDPEILKNSHHPTPREFCEMSLRFERAGMGINAFPTKRKSRGIEVKTEARFLEPKFLSVHAYGCKLNDIFERDYSNEGNHKIFASDSNGERTTEDLQNRFATAHSRNVEFHRNPDFGLTLAGPATRKEEEEAKRTPEVRIITLKPETRKDDDSDEWLSLHKEQETDLNDFHSRRVLRTRLKAPTERDKLEAILHVQKLIAQQANHVFQTQGPFSQVQVPFRPAPSKWKPFQVQTGIGTITELDENLSPIRPIPHGQIHGTAGDIFGHDSDRLPQNRPDDADFQQYHREMISREMEDVFLRGIKTLLVRYVEKQLEIPLKEALMVNIGYTISYG